MKNIKLIQKEQIKNLDKLIKDQYLLRLEIIGRKITHVYHHFDLGKKSIHISDMKILHLPIGYLWIKTDNGNMYKIGTNFLSWNDLDRGVLLEEIDKRNIPSDIKSVPNRSRLACWRPLLNQKITIAEWNWKGIHNMEQQNGGAISRNFLMWN